ncbi:hypothetical protein Pdca_16300 [Pseudonocardia autotrophica]|nr:hypothetical protein Pdca_16300 [Pseudonocardia autotrophica]
MRLYLGSDHAGHELGTCLVGQLASDAHDVSDLGPSEYDAEYDYPPFCIAVAQAVVDDSGSLGIVVGGSGMANRSPPTR